MKPTARRMITWTLALLMIFSTPLSALAAEYDLTVGDVTVNASSEGQFVTQTNGVTNQKDEAPVITSNGTETANTITVNTSDGADASVTIQDVNINTYADNYNYEAAITVNRGDGSTVTVNVEGNNTLIGENGHAALQTNGESGELVITGDGSLTATGGPGGAGIGGGCGPDGVYGSGSNITIEGGNITASGGYAAAGIGGASEGVGVTSNIEINGGTVTANGGECGAGIGGGYGMNAENITINGGTVTATGGVETNYHPDADDNGLAAGIGGGYLGDGTNISITGGDVTATGGDFAAAIGGGCYGDGTDIEISGGTVDAVGGYTGAGIGGGYEGEAADITVSGDAVVTAEADEYANPIGGGFGCDAVEPDISNLTENGSVNGVSGKVPVSSGSPGVQEPVKATPAQPAAEKLHYSEGALVTEDGEKTVTLFEMNTTWEEKVEGDTLSINAKDDSTVMTMKVSGLKALVKVGIEKIMLNIGGVEMELDLTKLIGSLKPTDKLELKLEDGKIVVLVNGEKTEF